MKEDNAKITSTMLGIEDHGVLTFYLDLAGNGWGQGCGGFALDGANASLPRGERAGANRVGFGPGLMAIRKILETVGVRKWEDLPGQLVRVRHEGPGRSRTPIIGHIVEDRWFDLKEFMEQQARSEPQP